MTTVEAQHPSPRERRRARTRRTILGSARELIEELGPAGLSLREVARRSDYSPAALYEYFDSKQELLAALLRQGFEELTATLEATAAGQPPRQRLLEMGKAYIDFAIQHPETIELIFVRSESTVRSLGAVLAERNHYSVLREVTAELLEEKGLDSGDAVLDARTYGLWAQIHGLALLRISFLKNFDADLDLADTVALERCIRALEEPIQERTAQ